MYKVSPKLSINYVYDENMIELDIPYHTRSPCQRGVDTDGNIIYFTKKSNYWCDKVKICKCGLNPFDDLDPKFGL